MGYGLLNHEDLLAPFCFKKKFQNRIFLFQVIESTMDRARALAKTAAPHLSAVIAENQTLGRGRLNRKWFSSKGGLWFTLILKPNTPPVLSYIYNFAASLSLSLCLRRLFDLDVRVKWPNDLLLNGQKLAGLLSEMETRGDMVEFINIGIGMNVNNHPKTYEPNAVSLTEILGKNISRRLILENFLDEFENRIQSIDCNHIIDQWKTRTSTIGTRVRIETLTEVHEGLAVDVDETGALIIEDWGGRTQRIIYGDCFYA
jgi:BirA family biotin operon repressor/biotin-[acetyl-CoA-carboxylase] ligase